MSLATKKSNANLLERQRNSRFMEISSDNQGEHETWILLSKTRHAIFRVRERELARYDISPTQALILSSVFTLQDEATTKNISRQLFREFHTIFAQLNLMEKMGLLQKIKDFPKKDRLRFVLTKKGIEAYHKSAKHVSIHKIMSVLSEEERQQLEYYLVRLLNAGLQELNLPQFKYEPKSKD